MLPPIIEFIFEAGRHASSADNSQPWHFFWTDQQIIISYDAKRVSGKTFTIENPASLLSIGSVIEHMSQAANTAGIQIEWTFFDDYQRSQNYASGVLNKDISEIQFTADHDIPLFQRHTNRLAYKKQALPEQVKTMLAQLSEDNARIQLHEDKEKIKEISELVYRSSEVRFQTQEVHEWLGRSLKFTQDEISQGEGLDVNTIDLPPGGQLFLKLIKDWKNMAKLNKIGGYKILAKIDAQPVKSAPALISIVSNTTSKDIIDAGRLMTRAWIELNTMNIAVQPFFVITDQLTRLEEGGVPEPLISQIESIKKASTTTFNLKENEKLQMLLRIGFAKSPAIRSQRLDHKIIIN